MIARLIALWFSVGVMWLVSASLYAISTEYYHVYRSQADFPEMGIMIERIFMTYSGWIYYYPAFFVLTALLFTWKMRAKAEWIWALVAVTLGTTLLFLAVFFLALESGRLYRTPYLHHMNGSQGK